ncbi:CPBP family intramembrane glutamic endopeptidase [Thermus tengchongensis]|uniref:CPBP family intramembrane metalloprotease n=1 Tax=Thermus tengchongensis TaxID=1214928 RepID=A0A4Y9FCV1_9DEIN|nr:CPBP family intramembrane glutamic endopeptidase [Thermus tengchongensis]TFU27034.1 CPBP family intramembrane metalloprotease [Thermus tengchongensis]
MVPPPLGLLLALQGGLLLLGASGMLLLGLPFGQASPRELLYALGLFLALAALEEAFRHLFPASFREAESLHRVLGEALRRAGVGPATLLLLALLSGVAEEVFFRGLLQSLLTAWLGLSGLFLQALVFALLHPAPRRAFAYPLYTGLAGLLFGLTYLLTGSLLPGILAHFLHNARGFYEISRS